MCVFERTADWTVVVKVANQQVVLKVDTGSQANLLPYCVFRKYQANGDLKPSSSVLRSYSGDVIKHFGVATVPVVMNDKSGTFTFFIVKKSKQAIFGLHATEALGLMVRSIDTVDAQSSDKVLQEFPQLFQGTGCVARPYGMVLHEDSIPVIQRARRVPLALKKPLRAELQCIEEAHIIERISEPTDWEKSCCWPTCYQGLPKNHGTSGPPGTT
nr:uncharacterized protein LOC119174292 [Rhipicephalus microplus]